MKICYFGIYNPDESRNRIYMRGLRQLGVGILECRDSSKGFSKYFRLFYKHWKIRNSYDFMIVGYPGQVVVWLARLISKKPVIFDALCTMEEGVIISRNQYKRFSLRYFYIRFIDWLSVKTADIALVESKAQRDFFVKRFGKSDKYKVVYTGTDDHFYFPDSKILKKEKFTVIFRGKFLPEAGVKYVIRAAKILENADVEFIIAGSGWLEKEVKEEIFRLGLKNIELISRWLSGDEIRQLMLECHISLGQLENHDRLKRTIPHKAFETLALGIPYITARAEGISEILTDGESCLMVNPADPEDLADKILQLKNNPKLADRMTKNGLELFKNKFNPKTLAYEIMSIYENI